DQDSRCRRDVEGTMRVDNPKERQAGNQQCRNRRGQNQVSQEAEAPASVRVEWRKLNSLLPAQVPHKVDIGPDNASKGMDDAREQEGVNIELVRAGREIPGREIDG